MLAFRPQFLGQARLVNPILRQAAIVNRPRSIPHGNLGRTYPSTVEDVIRNYSQAMTTMMDNTARLTPGAADNVRPQLRDLQAYLVNDIILKSDDLSDSQAQSRLAYIQNELAIIQGTFSGEMVDVAPLPNVPSTEGPIDITFSDAKDLASQFEKALDVDTDLVARYPTVRQGIATLAAFPVVGTFFQPILADIDARMKWISGNAVTVNDDFNQFKAYLPKAEAIANSAGSPTFQMDRPTYDLMRFWVAKVFTLRDLFDRMQSQTSKKPIQTGITLPLIGEVSKPVAYLLGAGLLGAVSAGGYYLWKSNKS